MHTSRWVNKITLYYDMTHTHLPKGRLSPCPICPNFNISRKYPGLAINQSINIHQYLL